MTAATAVLVSPFVRRVIDNPLSRRALPTLSEISGGISVSFEFFPPKSPAMEAQLWKTVERLAPVRPAFMSVTYGAGGTTREGTHRLVKKIQNEFGVASAAHLTCVDASRADIHAIAESYWNAGIRHIVALRGDLPDGARTSNHLRPEGYRNADALVRGLRSLHPFEISVAAYPEVHPQAISAEADLDALRRKVEAGATRAISQFFFDIDAFARFLDRAHAAGIDIPIVPGILPVTNFIKAIEFAKACHVNIPAWVERQFDGIDNDPETRLLVAATVAAEQCRALYGLGVRHFHFYTLNRPELSYAICHMLGVRATAALAS